jgi:hypothetical protein
MTKLFNSLLALIIISAFGASVAHCEEHQTKHNVASNCAVVLSDSGYTSIEWLSPSLINKKHRKAAIGERTCFIRANHLINETLKNSPKI